MPHTPLQHRRASARRLFLEGLEPRHLLSTNPGGPDLSAAPTSAPLAPESTQAAWVGSVALAGSLPKSPAATLIQTVPSDGAQLRDSVGSLVVTFPQDVDFLWGGLPIQLERIASDGTVTPLFDAVTPDFDSSSVARFTLDQPLAPGHYRVVLTGMSDISAFVGFGLWDTDADQTLADFDVLPQGATFDAADQVGTVGPVAETLTGALDPPGGANSVHLYKITLAPGHFWRLGVQLDAARIGSGLQGAIALFDASGTLIASRDAGSGRPDVPEDPFLFRGLTPGDYYIAVSGANNLPAVPGGYDPSTGDPGTAGRNQPGGAYQLELVADPADSPTVVTGFRLDWGDTLNPSPTGVTLVFSGPIDVQTLVGHSAIRSPVVAVDQSGRTWTLTPSAYDEARGQLGFVFDQALPPGRYTLKVADSGGLADLAGLSPTAKGLPAGVLANWNVTASTRPTAAANLGVLWPSLSGGLSSNALILPGGLANVRVVVSLPGWYSLQTVSTAPILAAARVGPDGLSSLVVPGGQLLANQPVYLTAGVHLFLLGNKGSSPLMVAVWFRAKDVSPESLINNGVGQSPALSLRFVNPPAGGLAPGSPPDQVVTNPTPGASGATDSTSSTPTGSTSASTLEAGVARAASTTGPGSSLATPVPASLLVGIHTGLLGRPSAEAGASGGSMATGLLVGQTTDALARIGGSLLDDPADPAPGSTLPVADGDDEMLGGQPVATGARPDGSTQADALALVRATQILELADRLQGWLSGGLAEPQPVPEPSGDDVLASLLDDESLRPPSPDASLSDTQQDRVERAEIGVPISAIAMAAAAYRLRQLAARWWRRSSRRSGSPGGSDRAGQGWSGPHLGRFGRRSANGHRPVAH